MAKQKYTFIDLFAGIGGIRLGLEQAFKQAGISSKCVFTSEIKDCAIKVLKQNHPREKIMGDITAIETKSIPYFDVLCGGFPCQAFSAAGNRDGFADTRGTLFFDIERIIIEKQPKGFILENVEGLVNHDAGNTLKVILANLDAANYWVTYKVLNSKYFGVPQERKRIYIAGIRKDISNSPISLDGFAISRKKLGDILEFGKPVSHSPFINLLLEKFTLEELSGKAIKDKRGGVSNIHSWDLELKGPVSKEEKDLLNCLLTERRKKKWAEIIGIKWMDGMPLTKQQIEEFYQHDDLQFMLDDLTLKGYIRFEHPKKLVTETHIAPNGNVVKTTRRVSDTLKPKGYNIVSGKLSFEVGKILSPNDVAPTLVATDMQRLYVADNGGLRKLTHREGLRLFGYPESFKFDVSESEGFDLLGNTVVVPVVKAVASRLIEIMQKEGK